VGEEHGVLLLRLVVLGFPSQHLHVQQFGARTALVSPCAHLCVCVLHVCPAGVTVYAPLRKYVRRPDCKVAVLGVGGLGHLAVQFADKMGADVSVNFAFELHSDTWQRGAAVDQ
jgi:threonine dehydrogenase-like Zn-dependent dehydrogenase